MGWLWDRLGVDEDRLPKGWQANDEWTAAALLAAGYYGYMAIPGTGNGMVNSAGVIGGAAPGSPAATGGLYGGIKGGLVGGVVNGVTQGLTNGISSGISQGVSGGVQNFFTGDNNIYDQDEVLEQITVGNQQDLSNQKEMFDYRINQGLDAGLTPYEAYLGPAGGAGGGTTGSGNTLGNAAKEKMLQQEQMNNQNAANAILQSRQQQTELQKTKMQTDAQLEIARIQSGDTQRGQNMNFAIQSISAKVAIMEVAMKMQLQPHHLQRAINEAATSTPEYRRQELILKMGVDNSINAVIQSRFKVDISDQQQIADMSDAEFKDLMSVLMYAKSTTGPELESLKKFVWTHLGQAAKSSEKTRENQPGKQGTLGNGQAPVMPAPNTFSVPGSAFPRG
jgi:hypothetical protein